MYVCVCVLIKQMILLDENNLYSHIIVYKECFYRHFPIKQQPWKCGCLFQHLDATVQGLWDEFPHIHKASEWCCWAPSAVPLCLHHILPPLWLLTHTLPSPHLLWHRKLCLGRWSPSLVESQFDAWISICSPFNVTFQGTFPSVSYSATHSKVRTLTYTLWVSVTVGNFPCLEESIPHADVIKDQELFSLTKTGSRSRQ